MNTITNILLGLILLAILARIWQAHVNHRRLRELIDSFADMTGDFLRSILDALNLKK
ncbi:MAG: hypothetical protein HY865_09020 [Chloroflexi bacterium]|nr:hypothetical protein [Chloroflexota bacterium]